MINRAAMILRYKDPALRWINEADPVVDNPGISMADVDADRTVYLILDKVAEDEDSIQQWIRRNYLMLFQQELEDWYGDLRYRRR